MAHELSFDEFYRATGHRVVRYALAMTGDLDVAQDITQEAYVRAWRRWLTLSGYEHPEAWIRLVVARLAADLWRRRAVLRRFEATKRRGDHATAPSETTVLVVEALRRLPVLQRQVLCLHYLLDLPIAEIAGEVGVPEGTVKSALHRGRSTLAALLAEPNSSTLPEGNSVH